MWKGFTIFIIISICIDLDTDRIINILKQATTLFQETIIMSKNWRVIFAKSNLPGVDFRGPERICWNAKSYRLICNMVRI